MQFARANSGRDFISLFICILNFSSSWSELFDFLGESSIEVVNHDLTNSDALEDRLSELTAN